MRFYAHDLRPAPKDSCYIVFICTGTMNNTVFQSFLEGFLHTLPF